MALLPWGWVRKIRDGVHPRERVFILTEGACVGAGAGPLVGERRPVRLGPLAALDPVEPSAPGCLLALMAHAPTTRGGVRGSALEAARGGVRRAAGSPWEVPRARLWLHSAAGQWAAVVRGLALAPAWRPGGATLVCRLGNDTGHEPTLHVALGIPRGLW